MMNARHKLLFSRAVLFCVLVSGVVMVSGVVAADLGRQEGQQWRPYLEWSVANKTYAGNPFDLVATVTFVHCESGEKRTTEMFYVFYREDATSIRMDLSKMPDAQPAIAVDALKPYREIELDALSPKEHVWKAPYQSDWAIAVGRWSSRSTSRHNVSGSPTLPGKTT